MNEFGNVMHRFPPPRAYPPILVQTRPTNFVGGENYFGRSRLLSPAAVLARLRAGGTARKIGDRHTRAGRKYPNAREKLDADSWKLVSRERSRTRGEGDGGGSASKEQEGGGRAAEEWTWSTASEVDQETKDPKRTQRDLAPEPVDNELPRVGQKEA